VNYNKTNIGEEMSDQKLTYYLFQRKSIKWQKEVLFHLFDLFTVNTAYMLRA
jgi:hypothetical protein